MKKKYSICLIIILMCTQLITVSATGDITLEVDLLNTETIASQNEILDLEHNVREWIDEALEFETGESLPADFDIDLTHAVKQFIDAEDLFTLNSADMNSIETYLEKQDYVWVYETMYRDILFRTLIQRCGPVTADVIEAMDLDLEENHELYETMKAQEGKWAVASLEVVTEDAVSEQLEEKITDSLHNVDFPSDTANIIICGGVANISGYIAIIENDETPLIVPIEPLFIDGTDEEITELLADEASLEDAVYDYTAIMHASNSMPVETYSEDTTGGTTLMLPSAWPEHAADPSENNTDMNTTLLLSGIIIMLAGCAGLIYIRRKSR